MSDDQQQLIVDKHNELRRGEGAANMEHMVNTKQGIRKVNMIVCLYLH